jgi:membrane-associated phospholipid phosphatase
VDQRGHRALIGAGVAAALLIVVNYAAFHIGVVERADAEIFNGFGGLRSHAQVSSVALFVAQLCDLPTYLYLCVIPVAIALYRKRWEIAVAILVILFGASESTELLKPLLNQHRPASLIAGYTLASGSWPSGHATAAMSLALCLVLAVAPRYRGRTAVGGAVFALGVTYSFLTLGWHYPSDAIGGFLMATLWTFLGVVGLAAYQAHRPLARGLLDPSELQHELVPVVGGLIGAAALVAGVLLIHHGSAEVYAHGHDRFLLGIAGLAGCAALSASWLLVVLRRSQA